MAIAQYRALTLLSLHNRGVLSVDGVVTYVLKRSRQESGASVVQRVINHE